MTYGTRITQQMVSSRALTGIQSSQARLARLQDQMSSGKVITKASDDPAGAMSSLAMRSELSRLAQYDRNSGDGKTWLGTIDGTLQSMLTGVNRARDIVVQGSSTGAMSVTDRQALATEINGLRQSLLGDANTSLLGRPVFGGTTSGTAAYDATGAYVGDSNVVTRTVGQGQKVRVDLTGPEAFAAGGTDLFALLGKISGDLVTNPAGLAADLTTLDAVSQKMRTGLADVGARFNRLDSLSSAAANRTVDVSQSLSSVEDADTARTILDLNVAQAAYQATLQSTAKVIQPSLLDYLR